VPPLRRIEVTSDGERRFFRALLGILSGAERRTRARRRCGLAYIAELDERFGAAPPLRRPDEVDGLTTLVLDASALRALEHGAPTMRARLAVALRSGASVIVPALALTDATIARTAYAVALIVPIDATIMAETTALLGRSRAGTTLDAIAVVLACRTLPAGIMSGDPFALEALVEASGRNVRLLTR